MLSQKVLLEKSNLVRGMEQKVVSSNEALGQSTGTAEGSLPEKVRREMMAALRRSADLLISGAEAMERDRDTQEDLCRSTATLLECRKLYQEEIGCLEQLLVEQREQTAARFEEDISRLQLRIFELEQLCDAHHRCRELFDEEISGLNDLIEPSIGHSGELVGLKERIRELEQQCATHDQCRDFFNEEIAGLNEIIEELQSAQPHVGPDASLVRLQGDITAALKLSADLLAKGAETIESGERNCAKTNAAFVECRELYLEEIRGFEEALLEERRQTTEKYGAEIAYLTQKNAELQSLCVAHDKCRDLFNEEISGLTELVEDAGAMENRVASLRTELQHALDEKGRVMHELEQDLSEVRALETELRRLRAEEKSVHAAHSALHAEIREMRSAKDLLADEVRLMEASLAVLQSETKIHETLQHEVEEKTCQRNVLEVDLADARKECSQIFAEIEQGLLSKEKLETELAQLRSQCLVVAEENAVAEQRRVQLAIENKLLEDKLHDQQQHESERIQLQGAEIEVQLRDASVLTIQKQLLRMAIKRMEDQHQLQLQHLKQWELESADAAQEVANQRKLVVEQDSLLEQLKKNVSSNSELIEKQKSQMQFYDMHISQVDGGGLCFL